jgi:Secretion system C-terminal sorting domain
MRSKHMLTWVFYCLFLTATFAQTVNTTDLCWKELGRMRGIDTLDESKVARYQQCMRQVGYNTSYIKSFFGNYPTLVSLRGDEEATDMCMNQIGICINVAISKSGTPVDSSNVVANLSQKSIFLDRPVVFTFPTAFSTDITVNTSHTIKVFVDFGDGQGERATPITPGQAITVSYSNIQGINRLVSFRIQTIAKATPNRIQEFPKKVKVNLQRRTTGTATYKAPDESWLITAAQEYVPNTTCMVGTGGLPKDRLPGIGRGFAHIQYANADRKLRKPVIIVEGLDFPFTKLCDTKYSATIPIKVGNFGWDTFISGIQADDPSESTFYKFPDMATMLKSEGYDVILLDFEDGADYIQKNALVLMALIDKVNQIKQLNGSCEQNSIVGASMGGQIVRFALAKMERLQAQTGKAGHDCKLYVSFDSPQRGAVIPLALQAFVFFTANFGEGGGDVAAQTLSIRLNRPAPQQLLIHHLNTVIGGNRQNTCNLRDAYLNELTNEGLPINIGDNANLQGYPRLCKNVAIACGNNSGAMLFKNDTRLICGQILGGSVTINSTLVNFSAGLGTVFQLELFAANGGTVNFQRDNFKTPIQTETNVIAFAKIPNRRLNISILGIQTPLPNIRYDILLFKRTSANSVNLLVHSDKTETQGSSTPPFPQSVLNVSGTFGTPLAGAEGCPGGIRNDLIAVKASLKPVFMAAKSPLTLPTFNCEASSGPTNFNTVPPSVCFIPAMSALDISINGISDLFYKIEQLTTLRLPLPTIHPFSALYIETVNLRHAEVTDAMNAWLLAQAKGGTTASAPLASTLPTTQGSTYNYGDPSNQTLPSVTINSGGSLLINNVGTTAYGSGAAAVNASFMVNTASCGATIVVNPQGKVRVGTTSIDKRGTLNIGKNATMTILSGEGYGMVVQNTSALNVRDGGTLTVGNGGFLLNEWGAKTTIGAGGTLRVMSGGTLRVSQYSSLIVENGANLIIEAGATIQLWDGNSTAGNATIWVKGGGALIINGNFNFSGNGYFQFDANNIMTVNNAFTLSGQNRDTRLIQLNAGASLSLTLPKTQLTTIQNGLIKYVNAGGGIYIQDNSRVILKNLRIEGTLLENTTTLTVYSPNYFSIEDCDFATDQYGIQLSKNSSSLGTSINNCKFKETLIGCVNINNCTLPVAITNSTFSMNKVNSKGISAGSSTTILVNGCTFSDINATPASGSNAIYIDGTAETTILKSRITGFDDGIITKDFGNKIYSKTFINASEISNCNNGLSCSGGTEKEAIRLECATFKNNLKYAIQAINVDLQIDAENNRTCATYPRRPNNFILSNTAGARLIDLKYTSLAAPKTNPIPATYNFWGRADGTSITNPTSILVSAIMSGQLVPYTFSNQYPIQQTCPADPTFSCKSTDILQGRSEAKDVNYAIFPNPASSEVNIQMPDAENSRVFLRNMFGSVVLDKMGISTLDVSGLPSGIYILSVTDKSGAVFKYHTKLVVANE